ncbi:MAG: hypothetical protein E7214_12035 [Clostridium sp.]|nr:hypothetical protein [Clostridium sp.]
MSYQLNLVNIDIMDKMVKAIEKDKVHDLEGSIIDTNIEKDEKRKHEKVKKETSKQKKYLTINGIKYLDKSIEVKAENSEENILKDSKGIFIDKVK